MAETFDDLYSSLRGNPEFSELFSNPGDFETFLKEEPNADQHMKELFNVDNATTYLKKKDEGDVSTSSSLLGGINAYESESVVEKAPIQGPPKAKVVAKSQQEIDLGNQVDGIINTISTETNNPYKALNQLVELNKKLKNPEYRNLVSSGKIGDKWVELNQKINELYKTTPMVFDSPQTKQLLKEIGAQDPSASAFGQQPQFKQGTFVAPATAPAKTAADYAAERKQAELQRTGDITQRGVSKETLATQEQQKKTAAAAQVAQQQDVIAPTTEFNQLTGRMEEKVSETGQWGSALQGIENELRSYDELRDKQNSQDYSTNDEQDFTERRRSQVELDFVDKLQPQLETILKGIKDNFVSEKEVEGEGIYFKRDRDGFLAVNPGYLNEKVDELIDNQKPGDALYLPDTEEGNKYKNDLKQAIKAKLTGDFNADLSRKIAEGRIGTFDTKEIEAKAAKEAVDYINQYDGRLESEVESYVNTVYAPVIKYEKEEQTRLNADIEQLNALVQNNAIDEQTYLSSRAELQNQIEDLTTQSMNMRIDASAKANSFLQERKKARVKDLEAFEDQIEVKYENLTKEAYDNYKKKFIGALEKYRNEQQDANAAHWTIVGGMIMPDLSIMDNLQSSLATIANSAIQLSGIQDYNVDFVDNTINTLSKIAVGNQYMGRSLSNSRSFIEGLGAVTQQLIDQVPTIGTAAAMGIITRNPYLTSSFMMYTDLAREAQNVQDDIIKDGGTAAQAQTAKKKVIDQHLLMTPLYFGQGSLLTGAARKAGSTSFAANYFKGLAMEYPLELTQEVWQEYTGQKFTGALKKADGTNKTFGEWLASDGSALAVDLLPTVALLGGAQALSETSANRKIIGDYESVSKFLGDKQLSQFVSDTYNVMGANMVNLIPQHLRATGQINDAEFKDLSNKFKNYVSQLADVDKIGLGSLDDSRYYLYQLSEIERVKKDLDAAVNPSTKKALQNKIDGLQKSVDNLIEGKEVNYVKFKFSNGASFVMSEEDAAKTLKDTNPVTNMMGAEITNKKGETVPMLTMETTNSKLNAAQQEIFKKQEKRKEATGVTGINIGEQYGGASVNNNVKIEGVIASSTVSEANAKARIEEARLAQTYLDEQMPGVKIVMFNGKDYNAFMPKVSGKKDSAGNIAIKYNEDTKKYEVEIHINLDKANSRTIGHEVTHAVLLKSFGEDIGKFTEFRQTMSKLLSESDNKALNDFGRNYAIDVQAEEYLAELSGLMQSQGKTIEKGVILKMMTYISDYVSKLTGGKVQPFKNVQNINEAVDFFNSLTEKLSSVKNAVQEQTAGQVPVQPETRTSEEVAQGESQAETQVAPQEGQEEVILESVENPLTTEDVIGREIEQGYEVFDDVITIDANKGRTDRGPITSKSRIARDFEINDSDFVDVKSIDGKKAIGFLGDVQLTGTVESPTGVKLNGGGGPFFPKQANRNLKIDKNGYYIGRAALWASTFENSTNKLAKKFRGVDVAMIGTQQITGILGNRKMLLYFGDELQAAIERGNSEESIINYINSKLDSAYKKPKGAEESISLRSVLGDVDNFKNIKEFVDYLDPFLSNEEFTDRHGFSRKVTTPVTYETRGSLFVKIFNIDAHKKFALPSIVNGKGYSYDKTVLEYGNDEAFKDASYGDFVGYVEFDPKSIKLEKVDENSDFYNPSYPWVITAEKVRVKYFNKFIDGRAIFYDNKPVSITANQTPFGLREKDQAARAIMGAMPTTTIEAKKVKQRQKGFESKSQLTAPSSNKWSPSLTQAEVDNIVGGDFASTLDEKVKEGKKHSTQIATTVGTYNKWVTWLEKNVPDFKNAEVLDVGAGLGHIHKAFGNKAGAVESYEPFYDKVQYQKYAGIQKPNYSQMDASDVPVGKYDVVVNNAVLNVVPSDIRESILNTIGDALKPGGIAIINAMDQGYLNSLIKKIDAGQSKNIKLSDTEVFVRESGKNSYQKGWTTQELQSYVQDVLGNEFTVEKAPSEITSMTTVLIKKNQMGSKSQLTDTITESKKLGVPQRYKGNVGKFIGGDLYVHKSAMDVLPQEAMERGMAKLPQGFDFEVVKYNSQSGAFSFIASPDWNTNPEPIVGDAYKVTADGNVTVTKQKADPQIYHHKWNFVRDNYTGFDIQESVQRSIDWFQSVRPNVNMFKIGTQSYWQNEALPNLKTTQTGFESKSQKTGNYKEDIVRDFAKFEERMENKVFPTALEIAEGLLPQEIFDKYTNLYEMAARNNIRVSNEPLPFGAAGAYQFGSIQLNSFAMQHYMESYEDFAETLNHEIIHGLLSKGIRNNYSVFKDMEAVMAKVDENYDSASQEVKDIIGYIREVSEDETVKDYLGSTEEESRTDNYRETADLEELITYAFTNTAFAEFLDSIPATRSIKVEGKSIFQQLKNIIRNYFKKLVQGPSALDEINDVLEKYFDVAWHEKDIIERNERYGWGMRFEAKPKIKSQKYTLETGFESKSQIDNANIAPEYQNAIASGKTAIEAYGDLIKTAYTNKAIKDALGNSFNQDAYDAAVEKDALATMNTLQDAMQQNIDDVKDVLNQNYISLNDTSALSDIRSDLKDQGYSDLSIFTAFLQMDFATPEQLQEVFGAEYRKTVQDALNRKTDFSSDFLDDLSEDAQNIKITNRAEDLTNAFVENGLTFVDAAVGIEYLLNYLDKAGLLPMASTLRDSLKDMKNDPKEVQKFFQTFSQLSSMAGRILNMARFIFERQLGEMIADSLRKNGIVLTAAQEKELQNLVGDFNLANQQVKENQKALEEDFSDEAFNKFWASEKELGLANTRLFQFLDARKPNFWNDRITSGGARGLLNFGTTVLSFTANIENNLYVTNPIARGIQKLRDNMGGGIKGNTLSRQNWRMARELTKKQSSFAMSQAFKYGNVQDINALNRYYDGLGQINFFRDANWTSKFVGHFIKQVTGKEPFKMTDEEFADAFDQTLIRMKDGDIKLRDGRTYTIAKSFFWTLSLGPQASELTGRVMAFGGDIMFGQMATQRAIIDYLSNIKDTRFQDGYFENQFAEANGNLNKEAIRAMSVMIYSNPDLKKKFEEEGLKRTLLADNFISKGASLLRGATRKKIASLYKEISVGQKGLLSGENLAKQTLQAADVLVWTLMPFTKVPANFLGSAIMKAMPGAALGKYIVSEYIYQRSLSRFNEKHKIGTKYTSESEKQKYEKDKINLFAKKRQVTYDLAQVATATALQTFALSAVKAGAILLADDEEKNKNLKGMNLRGGLYNATLHAEYLIATGQNLVGEVRNFLGFTNKKPINTKAWIASRGGYAKEGDKIVNINNFGFVGYTMGLWGAIMQGSKNAEQASILSFDQYNKEGLLSAFNYAVGSGVENLPMFQGVARIGQLLQDSKKVEGGDKLANFLVGEFSTSLAVFFPSFGSFMAKGNADLIQSPREIFPSKEYSWAANYGKVVLGTIQRLNRNVAFVEDLKNPYYEAMIGPFGEDLSYRVTVAEPGTLGAYAQAMFDPFAIRKYSLPVKEADKDKKLHIKSAEVHAGLMDLAMMYQQLSGRDFEFKVEGKSASIFQMISSPMYNDFAFDGTNVTLMGPDSNRNPKVLNYNLPNDLYRQELKKKGEIRANVFEGWRKDVVDTKIKVSTLIQNGEYEQAEIELELTLNKFKATSDKATQAYINQYINNRQKDYFIIMKQRGLITEDMMKQLQNVGIADSQGLISK